MRSGSIWTQHYKLFATDRAVSDYLGSSVAISTETIVLGAPHCRFARQDRCRGGLCTSRSGAAWFLQKKLIASDAAASDRFGVSVSVSSDTAVVGAPYAGVSGSAWAGAAYVYTRSAATWSQQTKLVASDAGVNDNLGWSVAVCGDTAVVGAPYADPWAATNAGAVYAFVRSGTSWSQQAKHVASDAAAGDYLGNSVAISGDTVIAGEPVPTSPADPMPARLGSSRAPARLGVKRPS